MALIKQTAFGGLVPSTGARALPDGGAQVANNLLATTTEFRPLQADTTAVANSGVTNPLTIYRLARNASGEYTTDMSQDWKVTAAEMNYAKAQVNDDLTERTAVTFADGSAAPRVIDALGANRLMGVPRPATTVTMAVQATDEYTPEDRDDAIGGMEGYFKSVHRTLLIPNWRGADHPGTFTPGWMDTASTPSLGYAQNGIFRAFRLDSTDGGHGAITYTYASGIAPDAISFVTQLGGMYRTTVDDWPEWAKPTGIDHYLLGFAAYGLTYTFNGTDYVAALRLILDPVTSEPLMTEEQLQGVVDAVLKVYNDAQPAIEDKVRQVRASFDQVKGILSGNFSASASVSYSNFYALTDVSNMVTAHIINYAESIWGIAYAAATAKSFVPDGG